MTISIPAWVWTALAVIAVLLGAYALGGNAAKRSAQSNQRKAQDRARKKYDDVAKEFDSLGNSAMRDRATAWVRNDSPG